MEQKEALELFTKIAALQRGRFTDGEGNWHQPLFDVRVDATAQEELRTYRVRVTPSRHLPDGPFPAEWKQVLDLAENGDGDAYEVRLDNAGLELV